MHSMDSVALDPIAYKQYLSWNTSIIKMKKFMDVAQKSALFFFFVEQNHFIYLKSTDLRQKGRNDKKRWKDFSNQRWITVTTVYPSKSRALYP